MRLHFANLSRPKAAARLLSSSSSHKLSSVQEAIARSCGYRNWHDLNLNHAASEAYPDKEVDASVVASLADQLDTLSDIVQRAIAESGMIDGETWDDRRHHDCLKQLRKSRGRLTTKDIARGKAAASYRSDDRHHESDDCIVMAYEWLDAQVITKGVTKTTRPIKHIIEKWSGRYVSSSDVTVAATLHPDIKGVYPHFSISSRLVEPSKDRLLGVEQAFKHDYHDRFDPKAYKSIERSF